MCNWIKWNAKNIQTILNKENLDELNKFKKEDCTRTVSR
jgi:hypothetical protein